MIVGCELSLTILLIIVSVVVIYILCLFCGRKNPNVEKLRSWAYTHRGLYGDGAPENSLEAFRRAKTAGYGVELDVHLLTDGNLAVIHDSQLLRMTGVDGKIEDLTAEQLSGYCLADTSETIPLFSEVLDLFAGEVPLIIELKSQLNNYAQLCQKVCDLLDHYNGTYCVESFDPRCVFWFRKNRPDIIRGQLTQNYFSIPNSKVPFLLKAALTNQVFNFLTCPDFVAYRYKDRKNLSDLLVRKLWKVPSVAWTVTNKDDFDIAISENRIPIFEGFRP